MRVDVAPADAPLLGSVSPPGDKSIYSGGGFTILELLTEELSGSRFADFMQREILEPLGMMNSSFNYAQDTHADFATAYDEQGEPLPRYRLSARAAGGLNSNIEEEWLTR